MINLNKFSETKAPVLQNHYWPPVNTFKVFSKQFDHFINLDLKNQKKQLKYLQDKNMDEYLEFIHDGLGLIYGYCFGYKDSPCFIKSDDSIEIKLQQAKIAFERAMLDWIDPQSVPKGLTQKQAVEYLTEYIKDNTTNTGVFHDFFDFLQDSASRKAFEEYLLIETVRNEVVDDEVAMLTVGMQGAMKMIVSSNLWDECGRGKLKQAHTYWLRQMLDEMDSFEKILKYREKNIPWFTKIMSNSSNMMFTRPCYNLRGYGSFLITESWVLPHFERTIRGLEKVSLNHEDITIYFTEHCKIDPFHTAEMLEGILQQVPELEKEEIEEILLGAHTAVAAGTKMYDYLLPYLKSIQ